VVFKLCLLLLIFSFYSVKCEGTKFYLKLLILFASSYRYNNIINILECNNLFPVHIYYGKNAITFFNF
jgi:hypothetical protein